MLGKRVEAVQVLWRPTVAAPQHVIEDLLGARIGGIRRRGKAFLIDLDDGMHLLLHPMMTGQLVWRSMP